MKIKMLTLQAGPSGVRKSGQTYDVPNQEASELIAGGYAVAVQAEDSAKQAAPIERTNKGKRGETTAKEVEPKG